MSRTFENSFLALTGALYLVYLLARLYLIPMTQDEVATCYNHVPRGVLDILTYAKEAVPNNHILNTLAIKLLSGIFGPGQLVARLPAFLGGVLYVVSAAAVARLFSANAWLRITWYVFLLANPFMAEFFALGRGYGISIGLMMPAIYFCWQYLEHHRQKALVAALTLAALGVMANFTVLNFYLPMVLLLYLGIRQQQQPDRKHYWVLASGIGVLMVFCALPVYRMTADNELRFWGTSGFYSDTLMPLVRSSIMDHPYLDGPTVPVFSQLIAAFSLIGWVVAVWRWGNRRWQVGTDPLLFSGFLLAGTITVNLLQHALLDVPFLNPRTAVFLYPLFALQLIAVGELMWRQWRKTALIYIIPLVVLMVINFDNNRNVKQSWEWKYDRATFVVLDAIKKLYEEEGRTTPYTFDTYSLLQNSLNFHSDFGRPFHPPYRNWIKTPPYHGDVPPKGDTDFYYTGTQQEIDALRETYEPVLTVEFGSMVLLRRKR